MSIIIGKIANKFWSNSGYKFPNTFPIYEHKKELKNVLPQMNDYTTGTVYLYGKEGNHCIYEGSYYNLYITQLIDLKREFYIYRLERDFGFEVLKLQPTVIGDLITSNNDKLLEENINRTFSAIDNPARVITINFDEVDFDGRKNFEFVASTDVISQKVLDAEDFNRFLDSIKSPIVVERKKLNKTFYSEKRNPAVFVVDILEPSIINDGGKEQLRKKINEFVKGIRESAKDSLKISKVEFTDNNRASPLNGKYCITHVVDGISVTRESKDYRLIKVDLSKLKDIVPINIHDLNEVTPTTNILKGERAGIFHRVDVKSPYKNFFAKIKRKAYVPYGASEERRPTPVEYGFNSNWNNVKNPQKIVGKYREESTREEYLWWVDNVNFIAHNDGTYAYVNRKYPHGHYNEISSLKTFISTYKFPIPHPVPGTVSNIYLDLEKDQIIPLGFFIFQIYRKLPSWFLFEYTGKQKLKNVEYISGIKDKFVEEYRKDDERGKSFTPNYKRIKKSDEFIRFYLDVFQFTGLSILSHSNSKYFPYLGKDYWGTYVLSNYKYGVDYLFTSGLYTSKGKLIEESFFSKTKYPNFLNRREDRFRNLLNFGSFELPEGVEIQEGDYFFSELDYEIIPYQNVRFGREKGKEWVGMASKFVHLIDGTEILVENSPDPFTFLVLEDFLKEDKAEAFLPKTNVIALCTTLRGNVDIRGIKTFSQELTLNKSYVTNGGVEERTNEIVQSVEGAKELKTVFTLMKKLSEPLMPEVGDFQITDRIKASIVKGFYKGLGYNVIGEGEVFWNWFIEEDFSERSTKQLLFDLVGTDGYCFITKGKISLISKKEDLFVEEEKKVTTLLHDQNKDLNLSLIEKVNQKVRLHFFTSIYYLNGKTTFSNRDNLLLYSKVLKPSVQQTQFEQHFVHLDTKYDLIYYENISVPKRVDKALSLGDSLAVQRMNMDLARSQYSYQIDQDRLSLSTKRYEENITRAQNELSNQMAKSLLTAGTSLATAGLGTIMTLKNNYAFPRHVIGKNKVKFTNLEGGEEGKYTGNTNLTTHSLLQPIHPYSLPFRYHISTVPKIIGSNPDEREDKYLKKIIPGHFKKPFNGVGTPGLGAGAALAAAGKLAYDGGYNFPEQSRQINVEKQLGAHELGIASLTIDTNYMDRQITAQQQLNAMTNLYTNPNIGEREVMDDYLKQEAGHKKTLNNIYLSVFIPSAEQLIALRSFKEEFGVMCDIPNVKIQFIEHMDPDVIRYRNLDDQAIQGIKDLGVREFFKAHLLAGIKIVEFEESQSLAPIEKIIVAKEKLEGLRRELDDTKLLLEQKTGEITQLKEACQTDKQTLEERLKGECSEDKDKLQKSIQDKEKELANTKILLNEKSNEITQLKEQFEQEKKTIEQKLKDEREKEVKQTREQLEEEHNKKLRDFLTQRDEAVAAAKRAGFESREGEIKELKNQLEKCAETDKTEIKARLDNYTEKEKEYCDLLKKYLQDIYEVNLNEREDGGNALRDLVIEIIQEVSWMRRANLDTKLGSAFPTLRPLLDGLMKLQEVPLVARGQDIIEDNFYPDYLKFLREGGSHNGNVDKIIKKVNDIKLLDLENVAAAHGIKATLDELNWLAYKAKNELNEPLKTNSDLQYFFKHIYPAGSLDKYQKLYGDPNIAIVKRKYIEQMQCFKGEGDLPYTNLEVLSNFEKTTRITVDDVVTDQTNKREEEENFVPSYEGKPLSTKREDIAVYMAPKYTKNAENFITKLSIYKSKYYGTGKFNSSYFSGIHMEGEEIGEDYEPKKIKGGLYLKILKSDAGTSIMGTRNFLWENRGRIKRDRFETEAYSSEMAFAIHGFHKVSENNFNISVFPDQDVCHRFLADVFGNKYWKEAKILLAIMATNCLSVPGLRDVDSGRPYANFGSNEQYKINEESFKFLKDDKGAYGTTLLPIEVNIMSAHKNSKELTDFIFGPCDFGNSLLLEFGDLGNLFSYVYRHVKLNLKRLEDPFGPDYSDTSKINFREILKTIYTSNQ